MHCSSSPYQSGHTYHSTPFHSPPYSHSHYHCHISTFKRERVQTRFPIRFSQHETALIPDRTGFVRFVWFGLVWKYENDGRLVFRVVYKDCVVINTKQIRALSGFIWALYVCTVVNYCHTISRKWHYAYLHMHTNSHLHTFTFICIFLCAAA